MRAPYQVLIIPFRHTLAGLKFAVLKRSDSGSWQFVSGGGEGGVAKRQAGIHSACTRHNHLLRGNLRWFGFGWGQWKLSIRECLGLRCVSWIGPLVAVAELRFRNISEQVQSRRIALGQ